jgi:hypothetical protein
VLGHVEVNDAPAMGSEHDENEENAQTHGGDREEVERDQLSDMVREERPPGLGRGGSRFGIKRETVRSDTSRPSLRSSPWMRGAPQEGSPWPSE